MKLIETKSFTDEELILYFEETIPNTVKNQFEYYHSHKPTLKERITGYDITKKEYEMAEYGGKLATGNPLFARKIISDNVLKKMKKMIKLNKTIDFDQFLDMEHKLIAKKIDGKWECSIYSI